MRGSVRRLLPPLLSLLLTVPAALAQSGMWGSRGITERFVMSGNVLYAAEGRGVAAYRVTDLATIGRIDLELTDDKTVDVAVVPPELFAATTRGLRRYAMANDGTLSFVEAIDERTAGTSHVAADPRWVATAVGPRVVLRERIGTTLETYREIVFQYPVRALTFVGGMLYAGVEREGTYVFDPRREEPVATLAIDAGGFAQQGSVLWIAAGAAGITSVDVTFPGSPRVIGNSGGGEVDVMDVAVLDTRAFGIQRPNKFYSFDISSPASPRQVAALTGAYNAVAARYDFLFVAGSNIDSYGLESGTGVPVRVMNPATLATTAEVHELAGPVSGAATDGSLAYVVDPPYLRVIDIHTTSAPREIASLLVPRIQDRIRIRRNLAVIYGRGLVNLIDISNPYKPAFLGNYDGLGIPPSNAAIARDTIIEGNYASGLHVVDYSNPANAVQISGRIWHYLDVVASDDAIYAILQNELLVADLTNRFKVTDTVLREQVGAVQLELAPSNAAMPTHLLIRDTNTIRVYTLADRFHPEEIGSVPMTGVMGTTDTAGWFATDGSLARINFVSPSEVVTTPFRVTAPMQIAGSGSKLVVADRYSLRVFGPDTPPPPAPPGKHRAAKK
jgi:hypothetical protein